ncbi:hypothetical protein CCO57_06485 [Salmonella enterica subsp. indica serovar Marseille]|nr:hypothetical protein CCO57_06485 [Salmonella enterica subsp. indica serovar Marseille]
MPPGIKPPQHCASPGKPGLLLILRQNLRPGTALTCNLHDASQTITFICQNTFSISEAGSQPLNSVNYASSRPVPVIPKPSFSILRL